MGDYIDGYLLQTCEILTATRNEYGDYVYSSLATENCRYRDISTLRRSNHSETRDSDGLFHLLATTVARRGSIIKFEDIYYQVDRFIKARTIDSTEVQFCKAEVTVINIAGIS